MNYNHYKIEIDGRDCTAQVPFPIKFSQLLDEQLDEASISIIRTKRKIFNPLTPVKITLWNGNTPSNDIVLDMIVASDKADELPVGSGKFNHELYLIEETKILEGFIVRSHGYVDSLSKSYSANIFPTITYIRNNTDMGSNISNRFPYGIPISISSPITVNDLATFPSISEINAFAITGEEDLSGTVKQIVSLVGYEVKINNSVISGQDELQKVYYTPETAQSITLEYRLHYEDKRMGHGQTVVDNEYYTISYSLSAIDGVNRFGTVWNGLDVVRRALIITEPLRKGETPRFTIDGDAVIPTTFLGRYDSYKELPVNSAQGNTAWIGNSLNGYAVAWDSNAQRWIPMGSGNSPTETAERAFKEATGLSGTAARLYFINPPEFQFTQSTLREILQGVGSFIHAEPCLKNGVIFYDFYGSGEQSEKVFTRYGAQQLQLNIERFATGIDSSVDNLVNSLGYAEGAIIDPFLNGYKNVLTESLYTRIDETNCFIGTKYPIREIIKLECYALVGNKTGPGYEPDKAVDITAYVVESGDYTQMSSYHDIYPYAKCYALYYTTGERNIYGLNFKQEVALYGAFKNYAILNIMQSALNDLSWGEDWLNIIANESNSANIAKFKFRVTYTPYVSARIKQSKSNILSINTPREISYTQGQNQIESIYYGEHLKGVVARIGNVDKVLTIVERGLVLPPKIGTIYESENGDYYVSAAAVEINTTTTKITLTLSKDFNKYSDYIGVDSVKRQYEISEKQVFDSNYHYRDYCVVGESVVSDENTLIRRVREVYTGFNGVLLNTGSVVDSSKMSFALFKGVDLGGDDTPQIVLPVMSTTMGNSAVVTCTTDDNFSAGVSVYSENNIYFANGTRYTDLFGEIEYLNLAFGCKLRVDGDRLPTPEDMNSLSLTLPQGENVSVYGTQVGNINASGNGWDEEKALWLKKGSTERLEITYQLDFVSNDRKIIIGSALPKIMYIFTGRTAGYTSLYLLRNRINKFKSIADLSGAEKVRGYHNSQLGAFREENNYQFLIYDFVYENAIDDITYEAWAIVDDNTKELIVGSNKQTKNGDYIFGGETAKPLYFTLTHDIYKKGE